ncbi:hypothetical protein [Haloglomus irregulare]|uniref:hypothetical protein n=1 Tax=Haloglomus irregulare TaxID=2234134 RepID=UPI001185A4C8|nr:hypothetical protein [Haloglomus irregulare]
MGPGVAAEPPDGEESDRGRTARPKPDGGRSLSVPPAVRGDGVRVVRTGIGRGRRVAGAAPGSTLMEGEPPSRRSLTVNDDPEGHADRPDDRRETDEHPAGEPTGDGPVCGGTYAVK